MKIQLNEKLKSELLAKCKEYDNAAVRSAWQANTDFAHLELMLLDSKYRALPTESWDKVMADSDTKTRAYIPEFRDCDKYGFLFKSEVELLLVNGCGVVIDWAGKHCFNCIMVSGLDKPSFVFIEPQADEPIKIGSQKCYSLNGGLVIF